MTRARALILIIDHDPGELLTVYELLDRAGYAVATAPSAIGGLRYVAEHQPDVVIAGLGASDLYAFELLSRIRAASMRAKVIFLAAGSQQGLHDRLLEAGGDGLLVRPPEARELLRTIERTRREIPAIARN